jgi:transposase
MIRAHAFVGLDVPKDTIAVAVADGQAGGEVRFWGNIENTPERLRALTDKLARRYQTVEFTYEAGP